MKLWDPLATPAIRRHTFREPEQSRGKSIAWQKQARLKEKRKSKCWGHTREVWRAGKSSLCTSDRHLSHVRHGVYTLKCSGHLGHIYHQNLCIIGKDHFEYWYSIKKKIWVFLFKYPKIRINPEWNGKIAQKWMEMAEKRAKPHITVELSFNCCHDQAPFPCFLLLSSPRSSFSLPLFVTRDHVSPLDLCWNMDEEMREMRAYGSLLNLILFIPLLLLLISVILTLFGESDESDVWALPGGKKKTKKTPEIQYSSPIAHIVPRNHLINLTMCWLWTSMSASVIASHQDLDNKSLLESDL